ncbi:MAG: hypothetical protein IJ542_04285 [Clostridia bacterium]|nr:hypothetical protein [Clostridia bacterium]
MKKNIAIVCLDRTLSRTTAQLVADQLEMRFFDMREMFEFDHKPNTFKDIVTQYGSKYYRQKEASLMKYASGFENVLLNLDSDCFYKKGLIKALGDSYLIIYLHLNASLASKIADKEEYSCYKEKMMYALSRDQISKRIDNMKDGADIIINASSMSGFKASSEVQRAINKYYGI